MTATLYNANDEPIKGASFSFSTSLTSQADANIFKTSPTIASGDVKVSKDGGSFTNITSLPSEIDSSGVIVISLSSDEMDADRVDLLFRDVAGAEWQDLMVTIFTKVAVTVSSVEAPTEEEMWTYISRTLTQSPTSIIASVSGNRITDVRGNTWAIQLDLDTNLAGAKIQFSIKENSRKSDSESSVFIDTVTGLVSILGETATTPANGSISVDDEPNGEITIALAAVETAKLDPGVYEYGVQVIVSDVDEIFSGTFIVVKDIIRATS